MTRTTLIDMTPLALGALAASVTLLAVPTVTPPAADAPARARAQTESNEPKDDRPESAQWPVHPTLIVTGFDDPDPYAAGHRGIDVSAAVGQVVTAARTGVVTVAGQVAGRPVVVLAHAHSLRTTYLPVIPLVRVGDRVQVGDPIGTVAAFAHCVTTTCLHWGARRGDDYIDPRELLPTRAGVIVLLPTESGGSGSPG